MWLMPERFVKSFPNAIVNIHPALLPKYGGKGMFGHHVHEAVVANKEKESGITIHWVNEEYDKGNIIFQATCKLSASDTPDAVAEKVHQLEYEHYAQVIEQVIRKKV
jgi:phosphoribosylglycinamide formyltransferase-1